jgi:hypothetical protein
MCIFFWKYIKIIYIFKKIIFNLAKKDINLKKISKFLKTLQTGVFYSER